MERSIGYRWLNGMTGTLFCLFLYGHIVKHIPYQLCELEHESFFISDVETWRMLIKSAGGMMEGLCQYLTQYLALPYIGSGLFLLPLLLLWPVTMCLLRSKGGNSVFCYVGAFGVTLFQLLVQYDFNYYLSGTLAMLGILAVLNLIMHIKPFAWQTGMFVLGIPIIAWLFGAVVTLYVGCGIILFFIPRKWIYTLLCPLCSFVLTLYIGYASGHIDRISLFLSPKFYYHPLLEMPLAPWFSWAYPMLLLCVGRLFPLFGSSWSLKTRMGVMIGIWIVMAGVFLRYENKFRDTSNQILWRLNHASFQEDWQGMLDFLSTLPPLTNLLYMNYANMALAQTGRLGDYAFHFHPHGLQALMAGSNRTLSAHLLMSDVYYTAGCIAEAQRHAFEAQVATPRMCSIQTLKRLVKTNLILGHDAVAEKYLSLIEKTRFHKEWAQRYRRFLYHPQVLEADTELGEKRRGLSLHNRFTMSEGWNGMLEDVLHANPNNRKAMEYLGVSYLLLKDLKGFRHFLDTYYETNGLHTLPISFQEGIVISHPNEVDVWDRFQVSSRVREQYAQYLEQWSKVRQMPGRKKHMEQLFGHTFWYYLMFTKI